MQRQRASGTNGVKKYRTLSSKYAVLHDFECSDKSSEPMHSKNATHLLLLAQPNMECKCSQNSSSLKFNENREVAEQYCCRQFVMKSNQAVSISNG